jgi:predicted ABC-type ATPase
MEKTGLKFANIDVDEIGKRLPEFEYFFEQNSINASSRTHMESVYIRDKAVNELIKRRKCFQLDGVMRKPKRYKNIISQLKKNGYEVNLVGITIQTLEAIKRAKERTDRNVEEDLLKQGHKSFVNTWIELCKESDVDSFSLYDNSQPFGKPPILIMDKNGIYDDNLYQRFLEKGKENF